MAKRKDQERESTRAVGYRRVSTVKQAFEGLSMNAQADRIERYCEFRGLELVELIDDPAVSGTLPIGNRPGGGRLVELLEDESIGHVVSLKIDRLFRSTIDCINTTQSWIRAGVTLHLVDMGGQPLATSSAMGRFFLTLMAAIAEWEAATISERTLMGLERRRLEGGDLGGAPYGMRWGDPDGETAGKLVEATEEAKVLGMIRELHERGWSRRRIARLLNDEDVPARGSRWHHTSIDRIVKRFA